MKDEPLRTVDAFSGWWVLTADQVDSRHHDDAVPEALAALHSRRNAMRLPFERTVGDELQGLTADARTIVAAITELTRLGGWRIGLGLGGVELPLPAHSREARGAAFIAAREAIGLARRQSTRIALALAPDAGAPGQAPPLAGASDAGGPGDVPAPGPAPDEPATKNQDRGNQDRGNQAADESAPEKTVSALPYGEDIDTAPAARARHAESALIVLRALLARRTPEGWQAMRLLDDGLSHREVAQHLGISESAVSQRVSRAQREEVSRAQDLAVALLDELRTAMVLGRRAGRTVTASGARR